MFLAVVLPSATYGLRSIHTNETLDFLDEVQGRLLKAWFGVSKYCSTSSLRTAIGWRKASEFHLSTSAEPKCILFLTRFNKIATQGAPQMAVDKEANSLSRVYSYYSKFNLRLFYV